MDFCKYQESEWYKSSIYLVFIYPIGGVNILRWKHLMTFTPSTRYCTVRHSPSFAIPQLSLTYICPNWCGFHEYHIDPDLCFHVENTKCNKKLLSVRQGINIRKCQVYSENTFVFPPWWWWYLVSGVPSVFSYENMI